MATFPSYAKLLRRGYGESDRANVLRSDMETSIAKQRPVNSRAMKSVSVSYLLETNADYLSFMAWLRDTIVMGSEWFTWTDPLDSTAKRARIVGGLDKVERVALNGIALWECRFTLEVLV